MTTDKLKANDPAMVDLYLRTKEQFEDFGHFISSLRLNKTIECVTLHPGFLNELKEENEMYQVFNAIGSLPKLKSLSVSLSSISLRALSDLLHQAKNLEMLHLRRVSFTGSNNDVSKFQKKLANHPSLQVFHLSLMATIGKPTTGVSPIVEALASISTIEDIYISLDDIETFEIIDISVFSELLQSKSMQRLSLMGCQLCNEHCTVLASTLQNNGTLKYLQLCRTNISHHGMQKITTSLRKNKSLETLCLANNSLKDDDCMLIADTIKVNSTLEILDLHENNFGREGSIAIFQALTENSGLKVLDLSHTDLTDDGVASLADAIANNGSLETLYLLFCKLSNANSITIANALQKNKSLKTLNMYGNDKLGNEAAESFVKTLRLNFSLENLEVPYKKGTNKKELDMHLKLNRLGRARLLRNSKATVEDWVGGLCGVSCDLNSIFYYLCNNPALCLRAGRGSVFNLASDSANGIIGSSLSLEPTSKLIQLQSEPHLPKHHTQVISRDGAVALMKATAPNATKSKKCYRASAA